MLKIHIAGRPDPAAVAARLRRFIAQHDVERRLNQRAIRLLMARNAMLGQAVGRLRRDAARYEHNVECMHEQRCPAFTMPMRVAA